MAKKTTPGKLRTVGKWILWALVFQFVLINISASLHAWKQTHFYTDPQLRIVRPSSKNVFVKTWKLFAGIKYPRSIITIRPAFPVDTIDLKTKSGLDINCWYGKPDSASKGTVLLFHGLSGNKGYLLREAAEFRYLGYNVMLIDLRGHGNSEGNATSVGVKESEEVKLAYDFVKQKGEQQIFLFGSSMGATVIAKAFRDYKIHPAGVILEMPIYGLQSFLEARSRVMGFPAEPFGFLVTAWIGIEQGYNGFRHKPSEYVKKIDCPVLLQWGDRDPYTSKNEIEHIYRNIPVTNKRFVIYEHAEHQSFLGFDPVKWREEIKTFLGSARSAGGSANYF